MLEYMLFIIVIAFALYRPAIALALLFQIYLLRIAVSSNIDTSCVLTNTCEMDNSPLFGAILPLITFLIIIARTFLKNKGTIIYQTTAFDTFFLANCIIVILGCLWSPDFMQSLDFTGRYLLLGIPYFYSARLYFQNNLDYEISLKQFLLSNYAICFILTMIGVYYYVVIGSIPRMTIPGSHPIPYSMMIGQGFLLACGIFFTGGQAIGMTQNWFKIVNLGMVFFFLFCQFLTNTRGVTIFMGLGAVILLLLNVQKIGFLKIILATPVVFCVFIMILSKFDPEALFSRFMNSLEHDVSTNERLNAWSTSIEMLEKSPILGVGTDGYHHYATLPYPHNYFLEMSVSFGILGIILSIIILLLFLFYAQFLSSKRRGTVQYQLIYILALFYFLESTVSFTLWMHKGLYLWTGILMILPPIIRHQKKNDAL
jgi:O-antigen ligase